MQHLIITGTKIGQDSEGRFCLNDLHIASGGAIKHQPANWLRNQQTQALLLEINKGQQIRGIQVKQGVGTFAVKEMVYSYAMWISPEFHLRVIRTFDSVQTQKHSEVQDPQTRALIQLLTETDAIKQRITLLESKAITRDESYFTAAGFCNIKGIKLDRAGMAMIGKMAASYSREHGLKVGKVYDSRYGEVNEYHTDALQYAVQA